MTATTPTRRRRRFRLSGMEMFGFIDTPTSVSVGLRRVTVTSSVAPDSTPTMTAVATLPQPQAEEFDPFADWQPTEFGSRLMKGRVRWGLVLTTGLVLLLLGGVGYWFYQLPELEAQQTTADIEAGVTALTPSVQSFLDLNASLTAETIDGATVNTVLFDVDNHSRGLFELSVRVPNSETITRGRILDTTSKVAEAQRLFTEAYTYRTVIIPILTAPVLETEPEMVSLEDAAATFSEWEARFETVRSSLPPGRFTDVATRLDVISASLPGLQRNYLDAIRTEDGIAAEAVVTGLATSLTEVETMLFAELNGTQSRVDTLLSEALATLSLLR